ncbi:hypothetical protein AB5J49_06770 [Streptomyces sp. R28]|uniref:Uncharacterized protein n=1 Tax=Streptomyces sp. R28 TaxID=3238628 RepID=A0AB39PSM8_9ACTN
MAVGRTTWWMQPGSAEVRTVAADVWRDAVRVPLGLGADVLRHLDDETGAVAQGEELALLLRGNLAVAAEDVDGGGGLAASLSGSARRRTTPNSLNSTSPRTNV